MPLRHGRIHISYVLNRNQTRLKINNHKQYNDMNRLLFIFLLMLPVANAAAQRETEVIETPQKAENDGMT